MRFLLLTLLITSIGLLTSCDNPSPSLQTFQKSKTVQEAKNNVDTYISSWDKQYKNLCDKPRNEILKNKFKELMENINLIYGFGEICENLSSSEQQLVSDYAFKELDKRNYLKTLLYTGNIECW